MTSARKTVPLLLFWAAASIGGVGYLMSFHLVPAAAPAENFRPEAAGEGFQVLHFLDAECGCSRIVARSLVRRGAEVDAAETVYWAGEDEGLESALREAGFAVRRVKREGLEEAFGVSGVPQLAVLEGDVALYAGGYAPRLPVLETDVRDRELIVDARAGTRRPAWPVFGCSTGVGERRTRDPLGWKYRR